MRPSARGTRQRLAPLALALGFTLLLPGNAAAVSSSTTDTYGGLRQTHTLFYNITSNCYNGSAGYAFLSWNTKWTRTAGMNMDVGSAKWKTGISGGLCSGAPASRESGGIYYPHFNGSNSMTWTLPLNWPTIVPILYGAGSANKSWLTRIGGGPNLATVCSNVNISNNFDGCGALGG